MAVLSIRDLEEDTYARLKAQARANGRSMEAEARRLLTEGVSGTLTAQEFIEGVKAIHREMGDPTFSDSTPLIREDRDSR